MHFREERRYRRSSTLSSRAPSNESRPKPFLKRSYVSLVRSNDFIAICNSGGKLLSFYPEGICGEAWRRELFDVLAVVDSPIESVVNSGYLIYKLPGVRIDVNEFADIELLETSISQTKWFSPANTLGQPGAVDVKLAPLDLKR